MNETNNTTPENWDPLAKAKTSKTFCVLPWIEQYVGPQGEVTPCCVYGQGEKFKKLGDLHTSNLKEIWNNDESKALRLKFLNGEIEPNCSFCNSRESMDYSIRNGHNAGWFNTNEEIQKVVASTQPDGSVTEHKVMYMDVRFNNLCNLKCRMCTPYYSTAWRQDWKELYNLNYIDPVTFAGPDDAQAFKEMEPHFPFLKAAYFAGGEPMMADNHYKTLIGLLAVGNTDVDIFYSTNFSILKLGKYQVLDYWKQFKKVRLNASLDCNHERAEYWRDGTDWKIILDNRLRLKEEAPNVNFTLAPTVCWPNALNVPDFHQEWVELGLVDINDVVLNMSDGPPYYSVRNIPDWKKKQIEERYLKQIEWLKENGANEVACGMYSAAIQFMYSPVADNHNAIDSVDSALIEFSKNTKKLDKIRGQSFFDVFPEHKDIEQYMTERNLHQLFPYH
jgi:hypothetical protein